MAWFIGFVLTLGAGVAGLYGTGGFSETATAYLRAHAVPPALDVEFLIVVLAVAVGGSRAACQYSPGCFPDDSVLLYSHSSYWYFGSATSRTEYSRWGCPGY